MPLRSGKRASQILRFVSFTKQVIPHIILARLKQQQPRIFSSETTEDQSHTRTDNNARLERYLRMLERVVRADPSKQEYEQRQLKDMDALLL